MSAATVAPMPNARIVVFGEEAVARTAIAVVVVEADSEDRREGAGDGGGFSVGNLSCERYVAGYIVGRRVCRAVCDIEAGCLQEAEGGNLGGGGW